MKVKSKSEVAQSCPILSAPMDCSLPGSSIHESFQARVLEWVAISFSDKDWLFTLFLLAVGFPDGLDGKESACNAGDLGLIPGLGRSSGVGHGNALQYSCLEIPMDRGSQRIRLD